MSKPRLLRIRQGDDLVNIEEEQVPYIHKGVLGHGLTAWVEEVEDQFTNKVYARKKMRVVSYTQEERARVFRNELSIIRGLERHHHMIRVFATYITSQYLSLILDPVASDGDLQAYLAMHKRLHDAYAQGNELDPRLASTSLVLQRAFGCLAAGLAFMHENNIRHKDVKPGNILIHHGAVIYTDFGCAFDSSNFTRSTTEGAPSALTRRYSSPELLLQEPRNSKSDVFSLGCVFVEIIAALTRSRSVAHASTQGFAPAMLDDLHEQLSTIQHDSCPVLLIETTIRMTQRQASDRICSTHAAIYLLQYPNLCCHDCSLSPLKDWSKRVKNDDCLPPMAETTLQSQESLSRLSIDPTTVQLSIPQSYPGRTQMEPNSGNNAYTRGSVPSGQGPQRIPPSQTVAQGGYGGILNTRYRVRAATEATEFFKQGRVFSTYITEAIPSRSFVASSASENSALTRAQMDIGAHSHARRFVIVNVKKQQRFFYACEIHTYEDQGTLNPDCNASEHAIIHVTGTPAVYLPGERQKGLRKDPIEVEPADWSIEYKPTSRINFGKVHSFDWTIKVRDNGVVVQGHRAALIGYYRQEQHDGLERTDE